jgi:cytochrome c-type biogenesis protein
MDFGDDESGNEDRVGNGRIVDLKSQKKKSYNFESIKRVDRMQDVSILVAFVSGLMSFFAPCVLPLLPAYISYVTGVSLSEFKNDERIQTHRLQIISSSIWYVLGFSSLIVLMGTTAASLGGVFRKNNDAMQLFGGILVMLFALHFMGVFQLPFLHSHKGIHLPKWTDHLKRLRAFMMGVIFATAWTPCIGAVLGAILTLAATTKTVYYGALLLFVYSLGISVPFLLLSILLIKTPKLTQRLQRSMTVVTKVFGVVLFLIGFLLFNNTAEWFFDWLTYDSLNGWLFKVARGLGYGG